MVLDEPFYSSDDDKETEHFIVGDSFYYENNLKGRVTNFLYEPTMDSELQNREFHKASHSLADRTRIGRDLSASGASSERRGSEGKQNERKYGMVLPSTSDREKNVADNEQSKKRAQNRTKNQRVQQDEGERNKKEEKKFEIINFGLV